MDRPNHGSTHRSAQGMPSLTLRFDCQNKVALPDDDSAILVFDCLGKTFSLGVVTHRGAAVSDEAAGTAMFFYIKTVRTALMQSAP